MDRTIALLMFAVFVSSAGAVAWMHSTTSHVEERMQQLRREIISMISWTHTLPGGGVIRVQVLRADYETEAAYDEAVAAKLVMYPPDPAPEGG